jgi:predicted nucleotidyltransferase
MSGSAMRKHIRNGGVEDIKNYVPSFSYEVLREEIQLGRAPVDTILLERAILSKLRTMTPDEFRHVPDVAEGLEHRIHRAVAESVSLDELYSKIKTKRYTMARIRRIILSAFLGLDYR